MKKDFWSKSRVAVIGGGNWGSVLANLVAPNCEEVRLLLRSDEQARSINSTRMNPKYLPEMSLLPKVKAYSEPERVFSDPIDFIIWVVPSSATRELARTLAPYLSGRELLVHATKGVEAQTLKRISVVLAEELPCIRIGVLSGPNLATEIAQGQPAATIVASGYNEVIEATIDLIESERFKVFPGGDMIGVEWAGTLKNILAIASGCLESANLGWNTRATFLSAGLWEMVRFGTEMGGELTTFLGLAGMGDLLATCSSPLSRNFRVGQALGSGQKLDAILEGLGSTAEGVRTTEIVYHYALTRKIHMPITEGVYRMIQGELSGLDFVSYLLKNQRWNTAKDARI